MVDFTKCLNEIEKADSIAVFPHMRADGDSIGSAYALALWLKSLGKNVSVLLEEEPEQRLGFLIPEDVKTYLLPEMPKKACRLAIAVDCADRKRLGGREEYFFSAETKIKIDHHIVVDSFGNLNFENPDWSANSEGLWELISLKPWNGDKKIATLLYSGIVTDTGSFAYSNTTVHTHEVVAKLLPFVENHAELHLKLLDSMSKETAALKGIAYRKMKFYGDGRIVAVNLDKHDFEEADAVYDDANEIVSNIRAIEGVEVAVFGRVSADGNGMKISLRSNSDFDVAKIAHEFNGGGHAKASGFDYDGNFDEFVKWMESLI